MILYGPPGTAKTTIAKKLAQDLEWPLLVINQSDFLSKGVDNIDAEADRIFRLASYLKKIVILFDEVEELVVNRANTDKFSRLLTTSMLPRIHHLRDRQRVVFIFATNHVKAIDDAASRLGRFDIIRCVLPPSPQERQLILNNLLLQPGITPEIRHAFDEFVKVQRTDRFSYGDLKDIVRRVLIAVQFESEPIDLNLFDKVLAGQKPISSDEISLFTNDKQKRDRP